MKAQKLTATVPFLLLLFLLLASLAAASASAARHRRLGFFYTRDRGRCTAEYWGSVGGGEQWPRMVLPDSTVSKVFGSKVLDQRFRSDLTLLESTAGAGGGDAYARLMKQGIAALLNSYGRRGYPYRAWEVKSMVIEGLVSKAAAAAQARRFADANDACN